MMVMQSMRRQELPQGSSLLQSAATPRLKLDSARDYLLTAG